MAFALKEDVRMRVGMLMQSAQPTVVLITSGGDGYLPLRQACQDCPSRAAHDMNAAVDWLMQRNGAEIQLDHPHALTESLLAPLSNPPHHVICVGKNYHAHAKEFARSGFDASDVGAKQASPAHPVIFSKPASSIIGHADDVQLIEGTDSSVDYEVELAVVIGKRGRSIKAADAMSHVFGYTIINDVTARDLQQIHKQWFLGKSLDTFCPMGPWIVTADEVDPKKMRVTSRVNGEPRQDASAADLIFDIPTLIETISRSLTLQPGDVIATGTPEGVGIGFDPPKFLRQGDVVECAISGIGSIRNRFVAARDKSLT
jgi:2-keto-4-pentenoate hydratase/2-oxohepta-3-ene-1,7-dioic acid hydratase in catechol pathway